MNWKEFFKPTLKRILIFLVLFILTNVVFTIQRGPPPIALTYGFPFPFYSKGTSTAEPPEGEHTFSDFNLTPLIVNLIFWYIIILTIFFVYKKFKK